MATEVVVTEVVVTELVGVADSSVLLGLSVSLGLDDETTAAVW